MRIGTLHRDLVTSIRVSFLHSVKCTVFCTENNQKWSLINASVVLKANSLLNLMLKALSDGVWQIGQEFGIAGLSLPLEITAIFTN